MSARVYKTGSDGFAYDSVVTFLEIFEILHYRRHFTLAQDDLIEYMSNIPVNSICELMTGLAGKLLKAWHYE